MYDTGTNLHWVNRMYIAHEYISKYLFQNYFFSCKKFSQRNSKIDP